MKILLAADGSEYTDKMLEYVVSHPALFDPGHDYVIFHSPLALPPHAKSAVGANVVREYHEEESAKVLRPALAKLAQSGLHARSEWRSGPAGEAIAAYADEGKYDLLLMGSHGHSSLARLVMGSVASTVLANCKVPVLLIR